jgi:hypothetical protein
MPIKNIQVPMVQTITDACVSECGNYYLKVCHDNDGAGFQYDCMMDNCDDLWQYVIKQGHRDEIVNDNGVRYKTPITELATGYNADIAKLKTFLDKTDTPYEYYKGEHNCDSYIFIGYHKDDLISHYGSDDVEVYKSTLKSWYTTWKGLATGNYTCYWFSIERVDNEYDENCASCGGFLVDDNLPYGEGIKDVMNSMREHFPSGVVFDDASFEHAIDNATY